MAEFSMIHDADGHESVQEPSGALRLLHGAESGIDYHRTLSLIQQYNTESHT
jgi:hypothetical protein